MGNSSESIVFLSLILSKGGNNSLEIGDRNSSLPSNNTTVIPTETTYDNGNQRSIIDDDVLQYIYTINLSIIAAIVSVFGIVTNCLNLTVFKSMNLSDTVNISLLALSLSDLISLISLLSMTIFYNPLLMHSTLNILTVEIQYQTVGWTRIITTRISTIITMYITLERCLCIALPLKIKQIITPKRVVFVLVSTASIVTASLFPRFVYVRFQRKFVVSRNQTMLGVVYVGDQVRVNHVMNSLNVIYTIGPFIVVIISSVILIWKLTSRRKWLSSATSATFDNADASKTTTKDMQIIKMVLIVASIFIVCFTPSVVVFIATSVQSELSPGKRFGNLFILSASIVYIIEGLNASVNIFVYHTMSSKYKAHFSDLVTRCKNDK